MKKPEQPQVAEGDELLGLAIEQHMKNYVPKGWVEPLHVSTGIPVLDTDEIKLFREWYETGSLESELQKKYANCPQLAEAILDFFERQTPTE